LSARDNFRKPISNCVSSVRTAQFDRTMPDKTGNAMQAFTLHTTPHIVFEPGGIRRLGEIAGEKLGGRVLLITDPGLRQAGLADAAVDALRESGATVELYGEVEEDPSRATVEAATAMAVETGATGIVGFGGGSSMDVAKLVSALAGGDQPLDEMWGLDQVRRRVLPLALVPTTAGTGSEVTKSAIVTLPGERKLGVVSAALLPDIALLDPDLTLSLPAFGTAATGIDAMTHAIDTPSRATPCAIPTTTRSRAPPPSRRSSCSAAISRPRWPSPTTARRAAPCCSAR
jgi:alcohol dehydrogenase class IV